jgi:hypothetical protein
MCVTKTISLLIVACVAFALDAATQVRGQTAVFEGARLITGDGGAPIESSAFIVEGSRFTAVGRRGAVTIPPAPRASTSAARP